MVEGEIKMGLVASIQETTHADRYQALTTASSQRCSWQPRSLMEQMTAIAAQQISTVTASSAPPISGSCSRREGRAQMLKFISQMLGG